jgi:predicted DNA-binding transcriptional regulator AlpA
VNQLSKVPLNLVEIPFVEANAGEPEGPFVIHYLERPALFVPQLEEIACHLAGLVEVLTRVADAVAPEPADVVDSPYVAKKLGCGTTWVGEMARKGTIPKSCLVPGTGNGKPWKFYRAKIEAWIAGR